MRPLEIWLKAGHTVEIIRRLAPEFTAETGHPVRLNVVPEGTAHDALVAGAARPDVITAPFWYLDELDELGVLAPLTMEDMGLRTEDFVPLSLTALKRRGRLLALPHTLTGGMLAYRVDLLEKHGLGVPKSLAAVSAADAVLRTNSAPGFVARCNEEFSSLETFAGWAAARNRKLLPDVGNPGLDDLLLGVSDLVSMLTRHQGSEISRQDYSALGEMVVEGRAGLLFDTSAWAFRFEAEDSLVRGRMGYTSIGEDRPAQFMYAEGLGITQWSDQAEAARQFLGWRHSERVVRAEVEEIGRIDIPRRDLHDRDWFTAFVDARGVRQCMDAIKESWAAGDVAHVAMRGDFVGQARRLMGVISGTVRGEFSSLAVAHALTYGPSSPQA